ncbi:sigma factor-like helix-turn-helix DNA-binding protein [Paractinoplanes rishiriensis]|uniref:RNA polymerase sigma24 factor n=1 Tax=Paractinoplanes rishiriensis TaxID=1050105 RepID=A0A919MYX5_9ACTN|nr:sigma factor-like helix-turn-helix DNA-binding protein [Actinoplanes rishiriensis]GIF00764.1 RNA polymerase sigma24 factor [Actinoplanes rishiriensis]
MSGDDEGLREFVISRLPHLRRSAFLMCGDWDLATDLTRDCLARVVADSRRGAVADPDVYAYADLMEACRKRNRRREHVFVASAGAEGVAAESILLLDALHKLAPRCRAVLVLRYWDGFDVDATGAMLDLDDERVAAYEKAGLAALEKLLTDSEAAMAG